MRECRNGRKGEKNKENVEYPQRCAFGRMMINEYRSLRKSEDGSWQSVVEILIV